MASTTGRSMTNVGWCRPVLLRMLPRWEEALRSTSERLSAADIEGEYCTLIDNFKVQVMQTLSRSTRTRPSIKSKMWMLISFFMLPICLQTQWFRPILQVEPIAVARNTAVIFVMSYRISIYLTTRYTIQELCTQYIKNCFVLFLFFIKTNLCKNCQMYIRHTHKTTTHTHRITIIK